MARRRRLPDVPRLIVRHPAAIAAVWFVAAAVLAPRTGDLMTRLEPSARLDGSESAAVDSLMRDALDSRFARYAVLVVKGLPSPMTESGRDALADIVVSLQEAPEVAGVFSYLTAPDPMFLGAYGAGMLVVAGLAADSVAPDLLIPPLRARAEAIAGELRPTYPDVSLRWTGETALNVDLRRTGFEDVKRAERRALPIIALLLLFAFGALVAAAIPVAAGALAIAITLGAAALVARVWSLSLLLQSIVTMLGLGLGIDYALLMVSRFRDALADDVDPLVAARVAARHGGHTILLSASTVALGFMALLVVPLTDLRGVAAGGVLVVLVSALLATTLVPGALAVLGHRVDWGRLRWRASRERSLRFWRWWGRRVTRRPWLALALGVLPLAVLALQTQRLRIGIPQGDWLPPAMESTRALDDLEAMGRISVIQSLRLVIELPPATPLWGPDVWDAVRRYGEDLESDPRVARVQSVVAGALESGWGREALVELPRDVTRPYTRGLLSEDGRVALLEVVPEESVSAEQAMALARDLRATPWGLGIRGARVRVGGLPAFNVDYRDAVVGSLPLVVGLVVVGTILALLVGFRSVLVPLKAVTLNLLSVAAAFGAVTVVFQEGHGAGLAGVDEPMGAIFSILPVIVFCIVFGLSMDYEVFLLTRVQEARRAGATNREAIVEAMGATGRIITNAALIMLVVFMAFTLGDVLISKVLGFALAVAVLLDATVVRMVVGPALLQLAGRWNWWPGDPGSTAPEHAPDNRRPAPRA
jgi:RND superfamily putative drug exporter